MTGILYLVFHISFRKLRVYRINFDHCTHINANDVIEKVGKLRFVPPFHSEHRIVGVFGTNFMMKNRMLVKGGTKRHSPEKVSYYRFEKQFIFLRFPT